MMLSLSEAERNSVKTWLDGADDKLMRAWKEPHDPATDELLDAVNMMIIAIKEVIKCR